jgi:hypothetical protein
MSHVNWNERSDRSSGRLSDIALEAIKIRAMSDFRLQTSDFRLQTSYRFLNSSRAPPWMLLVTPVMVLPSAESSPA